MFEFYNNKTVIGIAFSVPKYRNHVIIRPTTINILWCDTIVMAPFSFLWEIYVGATNFFFFFWQEGAINWLNRTNKGTKQNGTCLSNWQSHFDSVCANKATLLLISTSEVQNLGLVKRINNSNSNSNSKRIRLEFYWFRFDSLIKWIEISVFRFDLFIK